MKCLTTNPALPYSKHTFMKFNIQCIQIKLSTSIGFWDKLWFIIVLMANDFTPLHKIRGRSITLRYEKKFVVLHFPKEVLPSWLGTLLTLVWSQVAQCSKHGYIVYYPLGTPFRWLLLSGSREIPRTGYKAHFITEF